MAQAQVKRLAKDLFQRHRRRLLTLLCLTTVGFLSMSLGHWLFGEAVSEMQQHLSSSMTEFEAVIFFWAATIFGFTFIRGFFLFFMGFYRITTIQRLLHELRERLFDRVQIMQLDWHHKHGAGELITRTTRDCDMVRNATDASLQLIEIGTMLLGSLILLTVYHWQLVILPLVLVMIALFMYYRQAKVLVALNRKTDDAYDHVTQELTEGIAGVRVVKAFGLEDKRLKQFGVYVDDFIGHGLRAVKYAVTRIPLPQIMVALAHPWILILGLLLIEDGATKTGSDEAFAIGHLLAALMAMTTLIFRLDGMGASMRLIAEAIASMQRLSEVIYAEETISSGEQHAKSGSINLSVEHAHVKDDKGHIILQDCSFELKPGEIIAFIGATGSGKSILCSLLPRLKDVDAGSVHIVDSSGATVDIRQASLPELRKRIQVVPQESFLFSETLAANVRLGKADASEEEIWQALAAAGIDDFVKGLDDQLETMVGERGMNLSGGQKQRLCLARALISNPDILVLDDSTSALDAITEERIFKTLRQANAQASILLVTTRLSSVLLADRVMLLDDGRIVANDTHAHLAEHNERYRELLCLDAIDQGEL